MINYSQNDFALEVKNLSEKFKFYDKTNIRLMYEFCEFDVRKTFKVLSMV